MQRKSNFPSPSRKHAFSTWGEGSGTAVTLGTQVIWRGEAIGRIKNVLFSYSMSSKPNQLYLVTLEIATYPSGKVYEAKNTDFEASWGELNGSFGELRTKQLTLNQDAYSIRLSWTGSGVSFMASTDNGKSWESVENGVATTLKSPGRKVVLKAVLQMAATTALDGYTLEVNPTRYMLFTGKVLSEEIGLVYFGARWYDPEVGRFITVDPAEDGGNWYGYCGNNCVNAVDPDGKFTFLLPLLGFCMGGSFTAPDSGLEDYLNNAFSGALMFYTVGEFYEAYRFYRFLNTPIASSNDVGNSEISSVYHSVPNANVGQSVLNGISKEPLNRKSRFGKGFYVSQKSETTLKELAYHNKQASHTIRYKINLSKQKVLDLTNPKVARAWGFSRGASDTTCRSIAGRAKDFGYNVIVFRSYRGSGLNLVIFDNFEQVLKPIMISPAKM